MWKCFSASADLTPFTARPANIDLTEVNTKMNDLARKSETFDFSKEDQIPDLEFSEVIWKAVTGEHSIMPAPRRSAFLKKGEDD